MEIEDNLNLAKKILDFSLDNNERIKLFEQYFENNSENDSLELLSCGYII